MIVVTGAGRGIGKYLWERYRAEGRRALGLYRSSSTPLGIQVDLTQEDQVRDFVKAQASVLKDLTLVHCVGVNANALTHRFELEEWKRVLDGNLTAAFLITKHLLPLMREQNFGRLIYLSSVVAELGVVGTAAYASSKSGLWGLTKTVARENATKNITCNTLNLGYFDIGMISEVPSEILQKIVASIPVQRLGDPQNIYQAVEFLMKSDYTTGSCLDINGGLY